MNHPVCEVIVDLNGKGTPKTLMQRESTKRFRKIEKRKGLEEKRG